MNKQAYIEPEIKVIDLVFQYPLLQTSVEVNEEETQDQW